jgi:4-carboxymuconolactone decarboxylase
MFGERGLVEIIATIGYYTTVAMTLNAFEVELEEGIKAPFPL